MQKIRRRELAKIYPQNAELIAVFRDGERSCTLDECEPFFAIYEDVVKIPYGQNRDVRVTDKICFATLIQRANLRSQFGELEDFENILGFRLEGYFADRFGNSERKTIFMVPCCLNIGEQWSFEVEDIETIRWLLKL